MKIKNISGGVASLPSLAGTYQIADETEVDLLELDDAGLPLNNIVDVLSDLDLKKAFDLGTWAVVSNGVELTGAQSLNLLSNQVIPVYPNLGDELPDSIAITSNVSFDLWTTDLVEGEVMSVSIDMTIAYGPDSSVKIEKCSLLGSAVRDSGGSTESEKLSVVMSGNMPGVKFEAKESGNTFKIAGNIRKTTTLEILDSQVKVIRKVF